MANINAVKRQAQRELEEWAKKAGWASKKARAWLEKAKKAEAKGGTIGKLKAGFYNFAARIMKGIVNICSKTKSKLAAIWNKILSLFSKQKKIDEMVKKVEQKKQTLTHGEARSVEQEMVQLKKKKKQLLQQLKDAKAGKIKLTKEAEEAIKAEIAKIDARGKQLANMLRKNMARRTMGM